jgi:hypothetical protein
LNPSNEANFLMEITISYELRLKEGVGPINLGMSRREIKSILGEPELSTQGTLSNTDYYTITGLHIDYKPDTDVCKGIEVLRNVELVYQDMNILNLPWTDMFQWMLDNDSELDIRENGNTFISHSLGIATGPKYNEDLEDELVETILVFSDGYWLSEEEMKEVIKREKAAMPSLEDMLKEAGLSGFHEFESK